MRQHPAPFASDLVSGIHAVRTWLARDCLTAHSAIIRRSKYNFQYLVSEGCAANQHSRLCCAKTQMAAVFLSLTYYGKQDADAMNSVYANEFATACISRRPSVYRRRRSHCDGVASTAMPLNTRRRGRNTFTASIASPAPFLGRGSRPQLRVGFTDICSRFQSGAMSVTGGKTRSRAQ